MAAGRLVHCETDFGDDKDVLTTGPDESYVLSDLHAVNSDGSTKYLNFYIEPLEGAASDNYSHAFLYQKSIAAYGFLKYERQNILIPPNHQIRVKSSANVTLMMWISPAPSGLRVYRRTGTTSQWIPVIATGPDESFLIRHLHLFNCLSSGTTSHLRMKPTEGASPITAAHKFLSHYTLNGRESIEWTQQQLVMPSSHIMEMQLYTGVTLWVWGYMQ